ncbi:hypothetical protein GGG16DRAFT_54915 [Schizophyllum commune]
MSTQAPASYSVPSTPARLPPSPEATRSTKSVRVAAPTTPQRVPRHRQTQSLSHSRLQQYRTPNTPSSPYTPLSLRSFASATSSASSGLATPGSVTSYGNFSLNSPEIERHAAKDMSLADIAENWRNRACQNGIRVEGGRLVDMSGDMSSFGDDEDSDRSMSDMGHSEYVQDEVLLPPPFLSNQRRVRPRAQSFAPVPVNMTPVGRVPPSSPVVRRRLGQEINPASLSLTSTPPRNPDVARQLRIKGSLTDPAADRRREPFGIIRSPENSYAMDTSSFSLFDINEHEHEHEYDQEQQQPYNASAQARYRDRYNSGFEPVFPHLSMDSNPFAPARLSDPFGQSLGSIAEVNEMQYPPQYAGQAQAGFAIHDPYYNTSEIPYQPPVTYAPQPSYAINIPAPQYSDTPPLTSTPPPMVKSKPSAPAKPTSCSVCSRSNTSTLAVLSPCNHPLCSACLTSALNIVGEKDMECAVCKKPVADFKLVTPPRNDSKPRKEENHTKGKSFFDPLFSSPGSVASGYTGLESAFEMGLSLEATTSSPPRVRKKQENVVLRIDNVPWDITPPAISAWLQQPVVRAHVLLDRKGKTMSHAFVELQTEDIARAVLRGEAAYDTGVRNAHGRYERSSVLGSGKRARGVTVTRSGQEELMRALFPSWQGGFDGSRPSLAGLDNEAVIRALETGLMTQHEVASLMNLIKSPESPFLKVPCLPFYSLAGILSKFPSDVDSRVFWPTGLRDALYDISLTAIRVLHERASQDNAAGAAYSKELVLDVMRTAVGCQAFTTQQRNKIGEVIASVKREQVQIETPSPMSPASEAVVFEPPSMSTPRESPTHTPAPHRSYGDLAKELGIDSELVAAVANRLQEYR